MRLTALAEVIGLALDANFDKNEREVRQFLALVEEAGEFADAFVAYDTAYRHIQDDVDECRQEMTAEFADVVITLYVCAWVLDIALPENFEDIATADYDGYEQVLMLVCTVNACAGAFRRYAGMARRTGTRDELEFALLDAWKTARETGLTFGIDVRTAVANKADKILSRGWKDNR